MIRTIFGNPGCGKTTYAVKLAVKARKKRPVALNFLHKIPGVQIADLTASVPVFNSVYGTIENFANGFGEWVFTHGTYAVLDESGIDFNSRNYKNLSQAAIRYLKKHRHYRCDFDFISQSWDDIDITIRRLSVELWYLYKFGPWTLGRRIYKRVGVDQETGQIIDRYEMVSMLWLLLWPLQLGWPFDKKFTLTFRPFYYKYFDSWEIDDLPVAQFPIGGEM